ncbi:hypothetical protein BDK51DRAFT_34402 [Blyttiomyces helicus]|uniref:Uncharacterized protein n=1 Tax=Blyttiomyces helicus TaxID=388810 RepID=A0A4P9WBA9_9FUNG|nr:hypothetical protein BDK51DRAFT_34402 [Blyttiomyces helicus]|eukprot:RKO89532.1 hypothetical protein BDK51DRAFT_34402 [Blyttiomyces helicus]
MVANFFEFGVISLTGLVIAPVAAVWRVGHGTVEDGLLLQHKAAGKDDLESKLRQIRMGGIHINKGHPVTTAFALLQTERYTVDYRAFESIKKLCLADSALAPVLFWAVAQVFNELSADGGGSYGGGGGREGLVSGQGCHTRPRDIAYGPVRSLPGVVGTVCALTFLLARMEDDGLSKLQRILLLNLMLMLLFVILHIVAIIAGIALHSTIYLLVFAVCARDCRAGILASDGRVCFVVSEKADTEVGKHRLGHGSDHGWRWSDWLVPVAGAMRDGQESYSGQLVAPLRWHASEGPMVTGGLIVAMSATGHCYGMQGWWVRSELTEGGDHYNTSEGTLHKHRHSPYNYPAPTLKPLFQITNKGCVARVSIVAVSCLGNLTFKHHHIFCISPWMPPPSWTPNTRQSIGTTGEDFDPYAEEFSVFGEEWGRVFSGA